MGGTLPNGSGWDFSAWHQRQNGKKLWRTEIPLCPRLYACRVRSPSGASLFCLKTPHIYFS
jgi:hypothetical protein